MSFRIEKKYRLTLSDQKILKNLLFEKGLSFYFPSRLIHSCYFDNYQLETYRDSEEGCFPRKKLRIRWYNNEKKLFKETKLSTIEGRFKLQKK